MRLRKGLFLLLLAAALLPFVSTGAGLAMGIAFSFLVGNPWPDQTGRFSRDLLKISVVGLGFGMQLAEVWRIGRSSLVYTFVGIVGTMVAGMLLGRALKVRSTTATLVSFGTAICGGSAIAAMAPVVHAENEDVAVSLATVFTLNSVALFLFPVIGHFLRLGQEAFGIWAGIAIHDTSSVVGAASSYGVAALATGTTVKLSRAVWIAPCVLAFGWIRKSEGKTAFPWFIAGFIAAAAVRSVLPQFHSVWSGVAGMARQALVVTLFLIGAGLGPDVLRKVGFRPMIQGVLLWILVGALSLAAVTQGVIR
ncbi:MAG: hypothetical protein H6Q82_1745 [Deltaproteobacteria bacterium]|jgi:uncharacterized integral membrane protein (TIGR00698 family)|nr:hypothetical protein [Deltaproteobacteria bacterium]MBP2685974.1 hypothetical protein [Deltaproteobacteria bacterium]